jgi:hypothetical protein
MPAYGLMWSPFGGWQAVDADGNLLRLGAPYGTMPRRFKSGEAAHKAVAKFYRTTRKRLAQT